MRPARPGDLLLLAGLLTVYLVMQIGGIQAELAAGENVLPLRLTSAQGAEGHPLVLSLRAPSPGISPGDRVLRIGDLDLRGLSRAEIEYQTRPLLREDRPFEVTLERNDIPFTAMAAPAPYPSWWWTIPVWASWVLAASFLLLRAPHWHLRRHFFIAFVAWACFGACYSLPVHPLQVAGFIASQALGAGLGVWYVLAWDASARTGPRGFALAWAIGLAIFASMLASYLFTLPTGFLPYKLAAALTVVFFAVYLAGMVRAYRRAEPLERRKLRWLLYAHFVAILPIAILGAVREILWTLSPDLFSLALIPLAAIPMGYAVAIVGYGWLDVDRVISASAAATLVGIALLGALLAAVPAIATPASAALGIDPETGRFAFSMALAAVVVPTYRRLRPWLDRRLFSDRFELEEGFNRLRAELGSCRSVEEIATRTGEGFEALLQPESQVIYGRAGDAFTPLFVRGPAAPPAFETVSMLVQVLEARGEPLFARAKEIAPFERAALETLGAEVVVPQLRGNQLVAFSCLGGKRSGDIYTASDLALMASVAERCADLIARIDAETLAHDAQRMQSALRRYVPGAVADRVLAGDTLAPAEREVTVLFVDIRGYTGVAEKLAAEDVFNTLNEHTERVSRLVQENGGTIVEFNGDGMMAVFGAPEALAKKEQNAVEAARRVVDSMPAHLEVGVGVATGTAFVGSIRSTDRLIWSAVGSTTNLAARLQSLTRELGASIAIDETTRERASYVCTDFARHENLAIRGRTGRFDVFTLAMP